MDIQLVLTESITGLAHQSKAAKHTPDYMAEQILQGASVEETLKQNIELDLTDKEIQAVKDSSYC